MATYKIERWDGLITGNTNYPLPVVYIKGDSKFLDICKQNDFVLRVSIENSGSLYDIAPYSAGIVQTSACLGVNSRVNFYNTTHDYCITLDQRWQGYPKYLGQINILGAKEVPKTYVEFEPPVPYESMNPCEKCVTSGGITPNIYPNKCS